MKQVKSLILAVILVCALSAGAQGGDMGNPGVAVPTCGDMGNPGATCSGTTSNSSPGSTAISDSSSEASNPILLEILLALITQL